MFTLFCLAVDGCMHIWHRDMPLTDVRQGSESGSQDYIWCPPASALKPGHPDFNKNVKLFQERLAAREPVIVRDCNPVLGWDPEVSTRAKSYC